MIRAVVFDFDGVLADNYEVHYHMSTLKTRDITREEHRKLFEGNIHEEREKLKHRDTGYDIVTHFDAHRDNMDMTEDVKEMLSKLKKRFMIGVISSGKERGILKFVERAGIGPFDFVYGFETHKSKVEKFKILMKQYNLSEEDIIFVTDTSGDVNEAKSLGIKSIAIDFGFHERERLERARPFHIASSFKEVVETIMEMQG
jgi:phosphoglycolate phosphatase